jgi:IMP dehydrogenase
MDKAYTYNMNEAYTYNDVLIEPGYSEILSRSNVDLSTKIGNVTMTLPIISSNMRNVTGPKMARTVASNGGAGILHRFCTIEENISMYNETKIDGVPLLTVGVSIGVKDEDKKRFELLHKEGARLFCIDVAHGHHVHVKNMLAWITKACGYVRKDVTVIAGNVATMEGYLDLVEWGADAVKVGIGPSPVCRTRFNTGVGVPQLYALERAFIGSCKLQEPKATIADGGISCVGDIAKALKYADAVMVGSMLSGTSETPGAVYRSEDGEFYKTYGGSASGENKGENRFVEGIIKQVKFKGHAKYILREIEQGLQSAFSYVGASNHEEFQGNCELIHISNGSQRESRI